jgi:hypothetical protein
MNFGIEGPGWVGTLGVVKAAFRANFGMLERYRLN